MLKFLSVCCPPIISNLISSFLSSSSSFFLSLFISLTLSLSHSHTHTLSLLLQSTISPHALSTGLSLTTLTSLIRWSEQRSHVSAHSSAKSSVLSHPISPSSSTISPLFLLHSSKPSWITLLKHSVIPSPFSNSLALCSLLKAHLYVFIYLSLSHVVISLSISLSLILTFALFFFLFFSHKVSINSHSNHY